MQSATIFYRYNKAKFFLDHLYLSFIGAAYAQAIYRHRWKAANANPSVDPDWPIVLWVPGVIRTAPQPTLVWLGGCYSMLHVTKCHHLLLNLGLSLLLSSNGS